MDGTPQHDGPSMLRSLGFALRRGWRRVSGKWDGHIRRVYAEKDYLDAYSEHTDVRVLRDPHAAVGGMWYTLGKLQFDFLIGKGLQPHHTLLDIGCGTLRAGRHFARYLVAGHYTGIDISPGALRSARRLVAKEGLVEKRPRLLLCEKKRLTFDLFEDETFDFLLAYSVFTHLTDELAEECFANLHKVMEPGATFFFSYNGAPEYARLTLKDFRFPFAFFETMADRYGFEVEECVGDFADPGKQRMVRLTRP